MLPAGISTDTAPPLLFEGWPLALLATVTAQLLKVDDCRLKFQNAALLAYTAPPPPLAIPGRTDAGLVIAEHSVKLEFRIKIVKLNPANVGGCWEGLNTFAQNKDTWGECIIANAPP